MAEPGRHLNQEPPVRPTQVKSWLTAETMSPLGRVLMEIAAEIEASDETPMDEEAIERELISRRGEFAPKMNKMDDDQKDKNARMLFELHQRQLGERRQKIHSISERTIAVFIAVGGWIIAKQPQVPNTLKWAFSCTIIIIAASVCRMIWSNNRSFLAIAGVIRKLNDEFAAFELGAYAPGQALYPEGWKDFGKGSNLKMIWPHLLSVSSTAALPIIGVWVR